MTVEVAEVEVTNNGNRSNGYSESLALEQGIKRAKKHEQFGISLADAEDADNSRTIADLIAKYYAGSYVYDNNGKKGKAWYWFNGLIWEKFDRMEHTTSKDLAELFTWLASRAIGVYGQEKSYNDKDSVYHRMLTTANKAGNKKFIDDVLSFLEQAPRMSIVGDIWDSKPHLLVCENAIIDLSTGKEVEPRPELYLRKSTKAEWKGINESCPQWEEFLASTHDGNREVIDFLQTAFGYAFTGESKERKMFIYHGVGSNGKSVTLETLKDIAGDYGVVLPTTALLDSKVGSSSNIRPDLLRLFGARFVITSETNEGERMNVGLVKWVTGNDSLTARAPYEDYVTWKPTHKLFLSTNSVPRMDSESDLAIWDRIVLVNHSMRFTDEPDSRFTAERKKDPDLMDSLRGEASGILAWVVRGAVKWYRQKRLIIPECVKYDTGEERSNQKNTNFFTKLEEICDIGDSFKVSATELREAFNSHVHVNYTKDIFGRLVNEKFKKERTNQGYVYLGLKLKEHE